MMPKLLIISYFDMSSRYDKSDVAKYYYEAVEKHKEVLQLYTCVHDILYIPIINIVDSKDMVKIRMQFINPNSPELSTDITNKIAELTKNLESQSQYIMNHYVPKKKEFSTWKSKLAMIWSIIRSPKDHYGLLLMNESPITKENLKTYINSLKDGEESNSEQSTSA